MSQHLKNSLSVLRPYQNDLSDRLIDCLGQGLRTMAQLPTGGGKTLVFCRVAQHYLNQGRQVLVIAHREELILQAWGKLKKITGHEPGIIKAGYPSTPNAQVQVASIQTLSARESIQLNPGLIIIDEAHRATAPTYRQLLSRHPGAAVLGVTATPWKADGKGFPEFDRLVCGPTVKDLIRERWLCPYKLFADPEEMSADARVIGGDFSTAELAQKNNVKILSGKLLSTWQQHAAGRRTLVFAINVAHSKAIATQYRKTGIKAVHLDAKTKQADRAKTLQQLERGDVQVIVSVGLFSEGLDVPSLEVVQIARPTQSLALWLQMAGRVLRPCGGKTEALIIDHTDNWRRLGMPCKDRQWSLDPEPVGNGQQCDRDRSITEYEEPLILEAGRVLEEIQIDRYMDAFEEANRRFAKSQGYKTSWQSKLGSNL